MRTITLPAHFDGDRIVLDEPFEFEPNAKLIITVLPPQHQSDAERDDWANLAMQGLARAYGEDEPEYTVDMIKKANPKYKPR